MEDLAALERATEEFDRRLRAVPADAWGASTPCRGWTVRDLVNHVVGGNRMAVRLLDGVPREESLDPLGHDQLGDEPVLAWAQSAQAQQAAFAAPGAMGRVCHHAAGDVSGAQLLGFRVSDLVLHGWDLAWGVGGDERLDAELVQFVWAQLARRAAAMAATGLFGEGPSGAVGEDAPLHLRLLDLSGRRP